MPSHLARALMTADLPDVTTETETELVEEEHMLAISIATMIFLNIKGWSRVRSLFFMFHGCLVDRNEEAFQELGPPKGGSGAHEA